MKLHLPKILAAALVAAMFAPQAWAEDLTWTLNDSSSLNDAKWSNKFASNLTFQNGDNAIFSGSSVRCGGGTIYAGNVSVNGNTTVEGATIYSSGTVTIGSDKYLKFNGGELHVTRAIHATDRDSLIRGEVKIYYEGAYSTEIDFNNVTGSNYNVIDITKEAIIVDGGTIAKMDIEMYIDGDRVQSVQTRNVRANTTLKAYYLDSSASTTSVDTICDSAHADTNAIVTKGDSKSTNLSLSDKSVKLFARTDTVTQGAGKLTDLYLGNGVSFEIQDGQSVTFPDWVITGTEGGKIQNTGTYTEALTYNASEVTMKNLKVEVTETSKEIALKTKLENVDIVNAKAGVKLEVRDARGATSLKSAAQGAEVNLVNISDGTDLALTKLDISNLGKIGIYKFGAAAAGTNDENVGSLTMKSGSSIVIGEGGGTLEANLTMKSGSILDFTSGEALTMGCDVTMEDGAIVWVNEGDFQKLGNGDSLTLFTGIDESTDTSISNVTVFLGGNEGSRINASFAKGADGTGTLSVKNVPEPTTGTLSLLALAGLCARRRRK